MLGRYGLVRHETFTLPRSFDSVFQKCPVAFCVLSVSSLRLIYLCTPNKMTASLARIHVSYKLVSVFFCPYAFKRGKSLFILKMAFLTMMSSRTKFSSLVLLIRRLNELNGGSNIGLYSRMMHFLGTNRLRYDFLHSFFKHLHEYIDRIHISPMEL